MARIPDVAPMDAPRNASAQPGPAISGDLGLSAVGDALDSVASRELQVGQKEASRAFDKVRTDFNSSYAPAAANYDGKTPGFAADQANQYDMRVQDARATLSPNARPAFEQLAAAGRVAAFDTASNHEARASEERIKTANDQQNRLQAVQAAGANLQAWGPQAQTLSQGYDGSTPGFANDYVAAFDKTAADTLAATPDNAKTQAQLLLADQRVEVIQRAQAMEGHARAAYVANTVQSTSDGLVNAVISDPGQYTAAAKQVNALTAELPGELQGKFQSEMSDRLATAHLQGLAIGGQRDQAIQELNAGQFDGALTPAHKEELLRTYTSQADEQTKALNGEIVRQQMASDVASRQATGVGVEGFSPDVVRQVLGPADALKYQKQAAQAQAIFQATNGMAGMPRGDIAARIQGLKPVAGDPDFAIKEDAWKQAQTIGDQAIKLQETDPAKAAQAAPGVAPLFAAFLQKPGPDTASAYAQAAMAAQTHMGIAPESQRLLSATDAKALVHPLVTAEPGKLSAALQDLTTSVNAFGSYGGQVLRELKGAGLHADTAALLAVAGDDPVAMGQFARGIESAGAVKLDALQKTALGNAVTANLKPFVQTLVSAPGGLQLGSDLSTAVETAAKGFIAQGDSPEVAAKKASAAYLARYQFSGSFRMPANLTGTQVTLPSNDPGIGSGIQVRAIDAATQGAKLTLSDALGVSPDAGKLSPVGEVMAIEALREQALSRLQSKPGTGLYTPTALPGDALTPPQRRSKYADQVAASAVWSTTPDDKGLMLVLPGRTGQYQPVLGADGQPIVRPWQALFDRASKR